MKKSGKIRIFCVMMGLLFAAGSWTGCRSTITGSGDSSLVILVIDENNRAVKDFSVVLENASLYGSGTTNSQGICSFTGIDKKDYFLSGYKNGFTRLTDIPVKLEKNGDILCFSILSEACVFEKVLSLYEKNKFTEGLSLLRTLNAFPDSWSLAARYLYEVIGLIKTGEKREALKTLEQIKNSEGGDKVNNALKLPYTIEGKITGTPELTFNGSFVNKSGKQIKTFTVVFNVCDEDGESVPIPDDNVVYECNQNVPGFTSFDFSFSLRDYLQENTKKLRYADYEYLYVSQIVYEDGTIWLDPFGLEVW